MSISSSAIVATTPGWQAQLRLTLAQRLGRTVIARRSHSGPLQVQRAFYPETDGGCHVYVLHPPGGIVGGDALSIEVDVEADAKCLVTTPGASKIYRSGGRIASIRQQLTVASGGRLEWMPQETIAFEGSHSTTLTEVQLQPGADFSGWDIVCLGRRAANESFGAGIYRQGFRIWREQTPLCIESNLIEGNAEPLQAAWGLAGYTVSGTFMLVTDEAQALPQVSGLAATQHEDCRFSITHMRGVLVARYLGHSSEQAKHLFSDVWSALRPVLYQREAVRPRIWNT